MGMVKEMIVRYPDQAMKQDDKPLLLTDLLDPKGKSNNTFMKLKADNEDDYENCKTGLANYKLMQLWTYCEAKNAKNTTERKHGIPFFRVARFGFVSEPTPKGLACILNANTLYTVCTGTWQLVYGAIVISLLGTVKVEIIIPLGVSAISFILTVANVFLDFGNVLSQIEPWRNLIVNVSKTKIKPPLNVTQIRKKSKKNSITRMVLQISLRKEKEK